MNKITEFIKRSPKAEFHLHIEGTLEPELMFKLAKKNNVSIPICVIGSHVQALPIETLKVEKSLDFVFTNEGVYALRNILKMDYYQKIFMINMVMNLMSLLGLLIH